MTHGVDEKLIQNSVGKPKGTRPLGRIGRILKDNIKMNLREKGWDGVDWMHVRIGTSCGLL
jgi:hypothetical protein